MEHVRRAATRSDLLKSRAFDRLRCHLRLLLEEKGLTANQIARKFVREFQDEVREVRRAI